MITIEAAMSVRQHAARGIPRDLHRRGTLPPDSAKYCRMPLICAFTSRMSWLVSIRRTRRRPSPPARLSLNATVNSSYVMRRHWSDCWAVAVRANAACDERGRSAVANRLAPAAQSAPPRYDLDDAILQAVLAECHRRPERVRLQYVAAHFEEGCMDAFDGITGA